MAKIVFHGIGWHMVDHLLYRHNLDPNYFYLYVHIRIFLSAGGSRAECVYTTTWWEHYTKRVYKKLYFLGEVYEKNTGFMSKNNTSVAHLLEFFSSFYDCKWNLHLS